MAKEMAKFEQGRPAPHPALPPRESGTPQRAKPAGAVPRGGGMVEFDEHNTAPNNDGNKAS